MDPFAPVCSVGDVEGWWKPGGHGPAGGAEEAPSCPRCASPNTKFCYYNNYSLSQPRYFCKACRRYWTKGGSLRNVPVGGGCRKSRRSKAARAASRADPLAGRSDSSSAAGGGFSPDPMAGRDNAGAPDIDMATVFAKFLNQSSGAGDHEVDTNVVDQESPNDVEAEPTFAALKDVDPLVFLPCQEIAEKKQLGIQVQDLVGNDGNPLVLPDLLAEGDLERIQHDDGLLWSDTASSDSPDFTWQLESSFSSDDVWKISSNLMIGDNWNSGFDFSGFEVLSRP